MLQEKRTKNKTFERIFIKMWLKFSLNRRCESKWKILLYSQDFLIVAKESHEGCQLEYKYIVTSFKVSVVIK